MKSGSTSTEIFHLKFEAVELYNLPKNLVMMHEIKVDISNWANTCSNSTVKPLKRHSRTLM